MSTTLEPVALVKPLADAAPFSWFIGVIVAAGVYYLISERDIRQQELAHDAKVGTLA